MYARLALYGISPYGSTQAGPQQINKSTDQADNHRGTISRHIIQENLDREQGFYHYGIRVFT